MSSRIVKFRTKESSVIFKKLAVLVVSWEDYLYPTTHTLD